VAGGAVVMEVPSLGIGELLNKEHSSQDDLYIRSKFTDTENEEFLLNTAPTSPLQSGITERETPVRESISKYHLLENSCILGEYSLHSSPHTEACIERSDRRRASEGREKEETDVSDKIDIHHSDIELFTDVRLFNQEHIRHRLETSVSEEKVSSPARVLANSATVKSGLSPLEQVEPSLLGEVAVPENFRESVLQDLPDRSLPQ